jgi:hypothetical protein
MYNTDMPTRAELPSAAKLLRSTLIAIVTATVLLLTVVLPAEYGIDPTGIGKTLGLKAMGDIKTQLAAEAAADAQADALAAAPPSAAAQGTAPVPVQAGAEPAGGSFTSAEVAVTLPAGASTEIKMDMLKGEKVVYEWRTNGGKVNHDTHGEPSGGPADAVHRYAKEVGVTANKGSITAAFDGTHGWFWRNTGDKEVGITLQVSGQYRNLKQKL